jgi:putative Holliday junction resolvase
MRILGLDIGEKRIGVAVSDPSGTVATPLKVLDAAAALSSKSELPDIVEEYDVGRVVVGIPLSLDGTEGPQATRVRGAAARIAELLEVPIDFADERLSSVEAMRALGSGGVSAKASRGRVDMIAASLLLQGYLDRRTREMLDGED